MLTLETPQVKFSQPDFLTLSSLVTPKSQSSHFQRVKVSDLLLSKKEIPDLDTKKKRMMKKMTTEHRFSLFNDNNKLLRFKCHLTFRPTLVMKVNEQKPYQYINKRI